MRKDITMDKLDPNKTALVVVHMAKGVAGPVDTPFNRLFRERAKKAGVIGVQARLLDGFRTAKAKVVYTAVTYQPGLPAIKPNSPLFRTLVACNCLLEDTPAVEIIDDGWYSAQRNGDNFSRAPKLTRHSAKQIAAIELSAGTATAAAHLASRFHGSCA